MRIIKIGKADSNDIYKDFINDPTVSRIHCEIFIDDDGNTFLTDKGSTNGTFVNGIKILKPVKLKRLDIVKAGNSFVRWKEYIRDHEQGDKEKHAIPGYEETGEYANSKNIYKYLWLIFLVIIILLLIKTCNTNNSSNNNSKDIIPENDKQIEETITNDHNNLEIPDLEIPDFEIPDLPDLEIPDLPDLEIPDLPDLEIPDLDLYNEEKKEIISCPLPENGTSPYNNIFGKGLYDDSSYNSFKIKNTQASHAVVLLVNAYSGKKIRNEFVRKGTEFTMESVPNGTYYVRWVSGNDWCSDIQFGKLYGGFQTNMRFTETSDPHDWMKVSGGQIWTLTLYAVAGGDVEIQGLDEDEFFK